MSWTSHRETWRKGREWKGMLGHGDEEVQESKERRDREREREREREKKKKQRASKGRIRENNRLNVAAGNPAQCFAGLFF